LTLGCGLFGPALKITPRGEKHWSTPSYQTRTQYVIGLIKDKDIEEYIFKTWLEMWKHYDADYYEED
jgi:hypothetical protein